MPDLTKELLPVGGQGSLLLKTRNSVFAPNLVVMKGSWHSVLAVHSTHTCKASGVCLHLFTRALTDQLLTTRPLGCSNISLIIAFANLKISQIHTPAHNKIRIHVWEKYSSRCRLIWKCSLSTLNQPSICILLIAH